MGFLKGGLFLVVTFVLAGCSSWYVSTGPLLDTGKNADNSDIPWLIDVRAPLPFAPRCSLGVTHISSVKGGRPFNVGGKDDYLVTAFTPLCQFGPGARK
tara:strand:- start:14249 stop:14545 length:297 start_codon:yes stop_codon:yes gene_type:complete